MNTKTYTAILDQLDKRGNLWSSNTTRKLTLQEAEPLLKIGKIKETNLEPKRFVNLTDSNGKITKLTWGEYLKRKFKEARQ